MCTEAARTTRPREKVLVAGRRAERASEIMILSVNNREWLVKCNVKRSKLCTYCECFDSRRNPNIRH